MSVTDALLPWLLEPLAALTDAQTSGRLPHALLVEGPDGVGKQVLAERLSAVLLCTHREHASRPCGNCQSCRLLAAGSHPDYRSLMPEEGKSGIGVDQVRALISALVLTGQISSVRIGLVVPAHAMSRGAANSLLKTLEEPPAGTVLILVSSRPAVLPATVRSRCQAVRIGLPQTSMALDWLREQDAGIEWPPLLALAGGAPLRAHAYMESGHAGLDAQLTQDLCAILLGRADPIGTAERWEKIGAALCLDWLYLQVLALARARAGEGESVGALQNAGKNIDLESMFGYADELLRVRAMLDTSVSKRMALEGILVPWTRGLQSQTKITRAERA